MLWGHKVTHKLLNRNFHHMLWEPRLSCVFLYVFPTCWPIPLAGNGVAKSLIPVMILNVL